jgi:predicted DNA binding CopG/RHH family protein
VTDRRALTSRANLEAAGAIPPRLDPNDDTTRLNLKLSARLLTRIDHEARQNGVTRSAWVRTVIERALG